MNDNELLLHYNYPFTHSICTNNCLLQVAQNIVTLLYCQVTLLYCHTLQVTLLYCHTLQVTLLYCHTLQVTLLYCHTLQVTLLYCHTLQVTLLYCTGPTFPNKTTVLVQ